MDTTLKQRILGIIVLVALLGICLSVLLHHNKNPQHSKMPAISKTTTPPIVNTTSSLLNSSNSANMTPANTNVFDNDIPPPSNTPVSNAPTASQTQATVQTQTQAPTQTPAQPQTPSSSFNETSPQSPSQPVINSGVSPATVASSTIKPITPPPSSSSQSDIAAQINATTPNTTNTNTNSVTANTNTNDNNYALASDDDSTTPAIATTPKSIANTPVVHKAKPHAAVAKSAVVHKKSAPVHHANVVNTTATDTAINNDQGKNYVVQVGSFNLQANAETLADKLRAKGFDTTIQKSHTAQGEMTRVVVGKNGLDHAQVETLRSKLQSEMQIQGFITPQNISNTSVSNSTHSSTVSSNKTASKSVSPTSSTTNSNDDI